MIDWDAVDDRHDGEPDPATICEEYAGHEWAPSGGGMLICLRCEAESEEDDVAEEMRP